MNKKTHRFKGLELLFTHILTNKRTECCFIIEF